MRGVAGEGPGWVAGFGGWGRLGGVVGGWGLWASRCFSAQLPKRDAFLGPTDSLGASVQSGGMCATPCPKQKHLDCPSFCFDLSSMEFPQTANLKVGAGSARFGGFGQLALASDLQVGSAGPRAQAWTRRGMARLVGPHVFFLWRVAVFCFFASPSSSATMDSQHIARTVKEPILTRACVGLQLIKPTSLMNWSCRSPFSQACGLKL